MALLPALHRLRIDGLDGRDGKHLRGGGCYTGMDFGTCRNHTNGKPLQDCAAFQLLNAVHQNGELPLVLKADRILGEFVGRSDVREEEVLDAMREAELFETFIKDAAALLPKLQHKENWYVAVASAISQLKIILMYGCAEYLCDESYDDLRDLDRKKLSDVISHMKVVKQFRELATLS